MMNDDNVQMMGISIYPKQRQVVEDYARANGFSLSLAVRRIIDEWAKSRHVCTCQNADALSQFEDA